MTEDLIALREQCIKTVMGIQPEATVAELTKLLADLTIGIPLARAELMRASHVDKPFQMRKNP